MFGGERAEEKLTGPKIDSESPSHNLDWAACTVCSIPTSF